MNTAISIPEDRGGCYLLRHMGEVVYVGQSSDVLSRMEGHKDKVFDSVEMVWCGKGERDDREKALIQEFKPKYNSHFLKTLPKYTANRQVKTKSISILPEVDDYAVTRAKNSLLSYSKYVSLLIENDRDCNVLEKILAEKRNHSAQTKTA